MDKAHWSKSRNIAERLVICGKLEFTTPVAFGSGTDKELVDISLELDPLEGKALLTGATIAGALRSYLREYEHGYGQKGNNEDLCSKLFGVNLGDEGSKQSRILTSDSLGEKPSLELRDGIKIDPKTRTAEDEKKFDFELIEGAKFDLELEALLPDNKDLKTDLLSGLVVCLQGLEKGEIPFGIRKSRGFGKCNVKEWEVYHYDLAHPDGLIDWLNNSRDNCKKGKIADIIDGSEDIPDKREHFLLNATFSLNGSLLIRSGPADPTAPDAIHLHSKRNDRPVPVLSGTSLAGALRGRGLRIAKTIGDGDKAEKLLDELFGKDTKNESAITPSASKLIVNEQVITEPLSLVQNRIKIDRFTGGTLPTALFNEQPVFGRKETEVRIELMIKQPEDRHIGLMLLLLKDLWTGDLPLGGESSVGRGRLKGKWAELVHMTNSDKTRWELVQESSKIKINGDKEKLEAYVGSFVKGVQV